jgi:hypothetical protein
MVDKIREMLKKMGKDFCKTVRLMALRWKFKTRK